VSDWAQITVVIVAPVVLYLIWDAKRVKVRLGKVEEKLDIAHHRNYKKRILLNKVVSYIRHFCNSAYEILEDSRDTQRPVTDKQIERLRKAGSVDDILKEDK
jgi:hypothetical protein